MGVCLSHETALRWLRTCLRRPGRLPAVSADEFAEVALPDETRLLVEGFAGKDKRLDVMVTNPARRRRSDGVVHHVCRAVLPAGSFWPICAGAYAVSPELCFVQMAARVSLARLVKLGYEFCGSYALRPQEPGGFVAREPLTSCERLRDYVASAPASLLGVAAAREALRYVLDGSASPAETNLAVLLTLPTKYGGYALPFPELNARVELDELAARESGRSHVRCDLYWPSAPLCVEYNSDRHHVGAERIDRDAVRVNALGSMGVPVVTVTRPQLLDAGGLDLVAHIVAGHLGRRLRIRMRDFAQRRAALRGEILDFKAEL